MKHYKELWVILALSFTFFFLLSICDSIAIGDDFELKTAGFYKALSHKASDSIADPWGNLEVDLPEAKAEQKPVPTDTTTQTILFIGDSMLDGLSPRMEDYCLANGHKLISWRWYSSSTSLWGKKGSTFLSDMIKTYRPTYVFICLGANELFISNVEDKCSAAIDRILADIGQTPYVWIGPPNWKPDTGINNLIRKKTRPGTFFLSDGMNFKRRDDGAHPTDASAAEWLDSVMRWMPAHSEHPIVMNKPSGKLPGKLPGQIIRKVRQPKEEYKPQ